MYPQPGDTGVEGQIAWISYLPGLNLWVGAVLAFASIYGDFPAYGNGPNPLAFTFESSTEITAGNVTFNVVAGPYANYATNVANV